MPLLLNNSLNMLLLASVLSYITSDKLWDKQGPLECPKYGYYLPDHLSSSGRDGNCRGPQGSPGGLPHSQLWNVHIANSASYLQKNCYRILVYVFFLHRFPPPVWTNEEGAFCCHK